LVLTWSTALSRKCRRSVSQPAVSDATVSLFWVTLISPQAWLERDKRSMIDRRPRAQAALGAPVRSTVSAASSTADDAQSISP
jgi:hypothetical protein